MSDGLDLIARFAENRGLYQTLATCAPQLTRRQVWCTVCGSSHKVDVAYCFRHGWPKCCGYTMTIDSPEERCRLKVPPPVSDAAKA